MAEDWNMREELWQCYLASGADPDWADARHLTPGQALRAVQELAADYDEALDEIPLAPTPKPDLSGAHEVRALLYARLHHSDGTIDPRDLEELRTRNRELFDRLMEHDSGQREPRYTVQKVKADE